VFDVQGGASSVLWMHVPFFGWACDFASAFKTFHQVIFTSLWPQSDYGHEDNVVTWYFVEFRADWMGASSCPNCPAAMLRPYKDVGILMFHFRYINILISAFDISKIDGAS
jgi:hypothetical protein